MKMPGGGALNFFFGECVPGGSPKVGSRERIFLEICGVSGATLSKIYVFRAEILAKNKAHEQRIDGHLVSLRAPTGLKKRGP